MGNHGSGPGWNPPGEDRAQVQSGARIESDFAFKHFFFHSHNPNRLKTRAIFTVRDNLALLAGEHMQAVESQPILPIELLVPSRSVPGPCLLPPPG